MKFLGKFFRRENPSPTATPETLPEGGSGDRPKRVETSAAPIAPIPNLSAGNTYPPGRQGPAAGIIAKRAFGTVARPEDPSFTVMPNLTNRPLAEPLASPLDSTLANAPAPQPVNGRRLYWIGGGGLVVLLALAGYFWWSQFRPDNAPAEQSRLPKVWLAQHFGNEVCPDLATCGDTADPDNDGLDNYGEFREGTDPKQADGDEDGLADGDEVNVYQTDPGLKYTDRRELAVIQDYNDGRDIGEEYDPLTPGNKMTTSRRDQINRDIQTHGLHEPTPTTLQYYAARRIATQTVTVTIKNGQFTPAQLSIQAGDTVVWLNQDSSPHLIAGDLPDLRSPQLMANQTFSYTFSSPGTIRFFDSLDSMLNGTIEVK